MQKLVGALQKGDLAAAKTADAEFETAWRGVEGYLSVRSKSGHAQQNGLRLKIQTGLIQPVPNTASLAADAQALLASYDSSVDVIAKAPPLNPLFDDVARLRMWRANLREVDIALRNQDFTMARTKLAAAAAKADTVKPILQARMPAAQDALVQGLAQLRTELMSAKPDAAKAMKVIAGITAKYNAVLIQVTAMARDARTAAGKKA